MPEERYFTVDEANALVEGLRRSLERIRAARETVLRSAVKIRDRAPADGGGEEAPAYWEALRTLREEVEALAVEGVILRDADAGIVDFPSRKGGRVIYLCWRPEEDRVAFWHEVNTGFSGRKPL